MSLFVRVFHNGDHASIVWGPDADPRQAIPGCLGFAIYRKQAGQTDDQAVVVKNFISFDQGGQKPGSSAPSDQWPVQKFSWFDYALSNLGPQVQFQYKIVPLGGTSAKPTPLPVPPRTNWPDWTDPVQVSGDCGDGISCYFNRGVVASQWVARALLTEAQQRGEKTSLNALKDSINTPGDILRSELSGVLRPYLLDLLARAADSQNGGPIFAALYELNDPELMAALIKLGSQANVILANGAFKEVDGKTTDENADARKTLRDKGVNVFDRMVPMGHFAHNKFVVFCDKNGKAQKAWTGSTNWTTTGLCTQANNGILLEDQNVADTFLEQWQRLHQAGDGFPASLKSANSQKKQFQMGDSTVTVWFVPTLNQEDLQHAARLINGAQDGILFLMFEPGAFEEDPGHWTLLQWIVNRHQPNSNPYYNPNLLIRGVVNQDVAGLTEAEKAKAAAASAPAPVAAPAAAAAPAAPTDIPPLSEAQKTRSKAISHLDPTKPHAAPTAEAASPPQATPQPVVLYSSGSEPPLQHGVEVVVPDAMKETFGAFLTQELNQGVKIHSKLIVIDPFGAHPVVMTGSHNMGYKASTMNDDNLIIIENNPLLAQAYAANVISVYQQYRDNAIDPKTIQLTADASWQNSYFNDPDQNQEFKALNFWLKQIATAAGNTGSPATGGSNGGNTQG